MGFVSKVFLFVLTVTISNCQYDPHVYELYENQYEELTSESPVPGCESDSNCLELGKPKCVSGVCMELLHGGVLIISGKLIHEKKNTAKVSKFGDCPQASQDIPKPSTNGAAAVLDGRAYYCGGGYRRGVGLGGGRRNNCYIRSTSGQWTEGPSLHKAKSSLTLNRVGSQLVAIGGTYRFYNDGIDNSVEILQSGWPSWKIQPFNITPSRYMHCTVTVSSTQVILAGGKWSRWLNSTQMLNINTGSITKYADLPERGVDSPACALHQGRILLAGGRSWFNAQGRSEVLSLDYSSQGNSWIQHSTMASVRFWFTMEIVKGVPTVFGGFPSDSTMEQYVGGVWKSRVLTTPRHSHASVVIC